MHAIVRVAGVQARVAPGDRVILPRLQAEVGSTTTLGEVLLVSDGETITVGTPVVEGVSVQAEVLEHAKDKKVLVFKMKRRKRYRRTNGHRQPYTAVRITEISGAGEKPKKRATRKKAEPAPEAAAEPVADTAEQTAPATE